MLAVNPWALGAAALVVVSSLVANVALARAYIVKRDELAAAQSEVGYLRREMNIAIDAAKECSDEVKRLATLAAQRKREADKARAIAAERAAEYNQRADAILSAPMAVPGDECASAEVRVHQWLKGRK